MREFYMRRIKLPSDVEAAVLPNDDGTFDIYVNSELPEEKQREAFAHEVRHIKLDHLYNNDPVSVNEREANRIKRDGPASATTFKANDRNYCSLEAVQSMNKSDMAYCAGSLEEKNLFTAVAPAALDELWMRNRQKVQKWEERWLYDIS